MQDTDNIIAKNKWQFDEDVTAVFDNMLERSIPQYEIMRSLCEKIGANYVKPDTYIIDVGCSNGRAIEPFYRRFKGHNKFIGVEISDPMIEAAKKRFSGENDICIYKQNIVDKVADIKMQSASLILSVLTVQFTPIEYRQKIISEIYDLLDNNGAFIFVEKVLGNTYSIDRTLVKEYYGIKAEHQYTQEQIMAKRKSLEGVLVPLTAKWNENLLKEAGFKQIDCFWRCLNFAGWIAIK